jgi:LacI family transcriptional regulator
MPKPKRLSQAAIAKTVGVSRATVSLILRGGEGASDFTKTKVLAAAKKLGYRPNALVHSIRSGKSRTVGVLAQPHDSYWRDVCYGIHDRLIESEHLPSFLWNNDRLGKASADYCLKQIHRLLDHWVDGVILWPFFAELYSAHLKEFHTRNIPLAAIDHPVPHASADVVESDEAQMADLIVEHLAGLGHRRILVVSGPKDDAWADNRFLAMHNRFSQVSGAIIYELRALLGPDVERRNADMIAKVIRTRPSITAVITATDIIARSVYLAATDLKRDIPGQLSVASVADLDFAALLSPPLTTVRQDGYAIGRRAAQFVLERSAGLLSGPPQRFQQPGTFILRKSTGPA